MAKAVAKAGGCPNPNRQHTLTLTLTLAYGVFRQHVLGSMLPNPYYPYKPDPDPNPYNGVGSMS